MSQSYPETEEPRRRLLSILVGLGALTAVAGIVALVWSYAFTIATVIMAGLALVAGGIFHVVYAYHHRGRHHPAATTLVGILYVVVGALMAARPTVGAAALTLLLGAFFWVAGLSRVAGAFIARSVGWGWTVLSGLVSIALGLVVFLSWPISAVWLIGTVVGVELLFAGVTMVGLAFDARDLGPGIAPEVQVHRRPRDRADRQPPASRAP